VNIWSVHHLPEVYETILKKYIHLIRKKQLYLFPQTLVTKEVV
jgi:hypothetical protein